MQRIRPRFAGLDWAFIRTSSFNSLGITLARILGFAFSFVVAQAFASEEYGRVTYVITLAGVVAMLSQPFGQRVIAYLIGAYRDDEETRRAMLASAWTVWLGSIVLTFLISAPVLLAMGRLSLELYVVYIGMTAFYTYFGASSGFLASGRLLAAYLGSNLVQILLVLLVVHVFNAQDGTPALLVYGLSYFIPLAVLIVYFPLPVRLSFGFNGTHVRRILRTSAPIWVAHMLYMGHLSSDVIMIEYFLDEAAVGVYGLTKTLSLAFQFIPGGITMILMPKIAGMPKDQHLGILKLSLLVTLGVNLAGGLAYVALYRWFVVTFFGGEYFVGLDFALIMALGAILMGAHGVITSYFVGSGRATVQVISRSLMMATIILVGVTQIPQHGVMGAAVTNLVTAVLGVVFYILILIYNSMTARSVERTPALNQPPEG